MLGRVLQALLLLLLLSRPLADTTARVTPARQQEHGASQRNLLVLIADDFRPAANHSYGMSEVSTPNIDKLSRSGLTFTHAYSQFQWCSPSRNSFMSSRRPATIQVFNGINNFRDHGACVKTTSGEPCTSWPEHFKNHGFVTAGTGKTFHNGSPPNWDQPLSWSVPYFDANIPGVNMGCGGRGDPGTDPDFNNSTTGTCPGSPGALDTEFIDGKFRDHAVSLLQTAANDSRPFAFFVGFRRPHAPWRMPSRFYDLYNESSISIAAPGAQTIGDNVPTLAYAQNGFASGRNGWDNAVWGPQRPLSHHLQRHIRRSYYSAVSWMDDCVGHVMGALDVAGKADSTVVLLFADHGWKLGEHSGYSKTCAWETDTRVPLIMRVPWAPVGMRGQRSSALIELVDLFPTTSDLLGLALPPDETLDGYSFASIFSANPGWNKTAAYSQHPRCWKCRKPNTDALYVGLDDVPLCTGLPVAGTPWVDAGDWECLGDAKKNETRASITAMGYTMRTKEWRYTEWRLWHGKTLAADWAATGLLAVELYDHSSNPGVGAIAFDAFEFENLGYNKTYANARGTLAAALKAQFSQPSHTKTVALKIDDAPRKPRTGLRTPPLGFNT